eukprot:TRINITY_DN5519_c0_g1_i1.p1 TRINITY_DN5519_c0_g1~~TRINITY_DN5519_c0_g1_i1.p1  ORF type:complete len:874 (-),score=146.82 TRINITY_DN5519_c0_g1_i1:111-2732(-)
MAAIALPCSVATLLFGALVLACISYGGFSNSTNSTEPQSRWPVAPHAPAPAVPKASHHLRRLQETTLCTSNESSSRLQVDKPQLGERCPVCALPDVDTCIYNVSDCLGIRAGGSCQIGCAAPYFGKPTVANCSADAGSDGLEWTLPDCTCEPPKEQLGYKRNMWTGEMECDDGFLGFPEVSCKSTAMCADVTSKWVGCLPLTPCAPPVVDKCRFDGSACDSVRPGETCEIKCQKGLVGYSTIASCPITNTNPLTELSWFPLVCVMETCKLPEELAEGYAVDEDGNVVCADGYAGNARTECLPADGWWPNCETTVNFYGCKKVVNCGPPPISSDDACRYDFSGCASVAPGTNCSVFCKAPYVPTSLDPGNGSCPDANTNTSALSWTGPACILRDCPDPETTPEGYLHKGGDDWECAHSFEGSPQKKCYVTEAPECFAAGRFEGCNRLMACRPPKEMEADCRLDLTDCLTVAPGGSCKVACRAPMIGNATMASCPAFNNDPWTGLSWTAPKCEQGVCANPIDLPEGYELDRSRGYGILKCAEGYAGSVKRTCIFREDVCQEIAELSGCLPVVPCRPPTLPKEQECSYNMSACAEVPSGESCEVTCMPTLKPGSTVASCPADNTDPEQELILSALGCDCFDPDPLPVGYNTTGAVAGGSAFQCALGYAGQAEKVCRSMVKSDGQCKTRREPGAMVGCAVPLTCEVMAFQDTGSSALGLRGLVRFGAAKMEGGAVSERGIKGYRLVFADDCGTRLGDVAEGIIEKSGDVDWSCCLPDAYSVRLDNVFVPKSATRVLVLVVTESDMGELMDAQVAAAIPMPQGQAASVLLSTGEGSCVGAACRLFGSAHEGLRQSARFGTLLTTALVLASRLLLDESS